MMTEFEADNTIEKRPLSDPIEAMYTLSMCTFWSQARA